MNTLTVVAVIRIHPSLYWTPEAARARERIRASVIAPLATAAPSVLTASPIQAPATMGSWCRNAWAAKGRRINSNTAKMTTSDETITGTTGRARIAAPVAMAAETPQIEMPEARGAAHSRLNLKNLRATR